MVVEPRRGTGLARERLAAATVEVRALGGTDATAVADLLQASGVRIGSEGVTLTVVLVDDYLTDELAEINEQALECGQPWLLARPGRAIILVGPVFESDRGPCWECLAQRLRLNQRHGLNRVWPAVRAAIARAHPAGGGIGDRVRADRHRSRALAR